MIFLAAAIYPHLLCFTSVKSLTGFLRIARGAVQTALHVPETLGRRRFHEQGMLTRRPAALLAFLAQLLTFVRDHRDVNEHEGLSISKKTLLSC